MPRLFIALDLPEETTAELDRLCVGLPGARWTDPGDFHLTLRFIGEVDHATFCEVGEALASVSLRPFEMRLKGLGEFPPRGPMHTLWAGIEAPDALMQLKRRLDRVCDEAGVAREKRKFVPHVTLARFREPPPHERYASWLARRALFRTAPFPVSHFTLYSSILRSDGAEHVPEASYDFVSGVAERV
ncbi:RNA 2',3'-cyclic phosphodiesterase [Geminicoccaceae bacterium 1502E]|nr:RNA 2',3'-cyclic phosphodiesterase [Geminicoccaceae bacterium 1502E]